MKCLSLGTHFFTVTFSSELRPRRETGEDQIVQLIYYYVLSKMKNKGKKRTNLGIYELSLLTLLFLSSTFKLKENVSKGCPHYITIVLRYSTGQSRNICWFDLSHWYKVDAGRMAENCFILPNHSDKKSSPYHILQHWKTA